MSILIISSSLSLVFNALDANLPYQIDTVNILQENRVMHVLMHSARVSV